MFVTKDDQWGIRTKLKDVFSKYNHTKKRPYWEHEIFDKEFEFNIFFNQYLNPIWYEDSASIQRHLDEIIKCARSFKDGMVWTNRGGSASFDEYNRGLKDVISTGYARLLTYYEIHKDVQKWQENKSYKYEKIPPPPEEEMIQLKIHKREVKII